MRNTGTNPADARVFHPHPDNNGREVWLRRPSTPTAPQTWLDPDAAACFVPGGAVPDTLNGIRLQPWKNPPSSDQQWGALCGTSEFGEPAFNAPSHLAPAAGVVLREPDGRYWLVSPSNQFGGYETTFPKGRVDPGSGLQVTAIREAFEEAGLQVELTGFLCDTLRTQSYTRYYTGKRVGGSPASMGWETQAVRLVPGRLLAQYLTHPSDAPLLAALAAGG